MIIVPSSKQPTSCLQTTTTGPFGITQSRSYLKMQFWKWLTFNTLFYSNEE